MTATREEFPHFDGTYEQLQRMVSLTGIGGSWRDLNGQKQKQFIAENGAIVNYWPATRTINFRGQPEATKK
jgi:hypothetical protein